MLECQCVGYFLSNSIKYGEGGRYGFSPFCVPNLIFAYSKGIQTREPLLNIKSWGYNRAKIFLTESSNVVHLPYIQTREDFIKSIVDRVYAFEKIHLNGFGINNIHINNHSSINPKKEIDVIVDYNKFKNSTEFKFYGKLFENNILKCERGQFFLKNGSHNF